ncbi:MAG: C39 family peptidase [Cellulosilyticaceae bacterium]
MNLKKQIIWTSLCIIMIFGWGNVEAMEKVIIPNVPIISQKPKLPTGCEATALTMILQYYGVNITKEQVAKDMPKAPRPKMVNGKLTGESPNNAFIGDPFAKNGFGVFSPVIYKMVEKYLPERAEDLGGGDFSKVYRALDEGRPVMLWVTIGMKPSRVNSSWTTSRGEKVVWKTPEHAVVAVGYDKSYIYINDPYTGTQSKFSKDIVEKRWVEMGKQAIAIKAAKETKIEPITEVGNAIIDGITYKNMISRGYENDELKEWIPVRMLNGVHEGTSVDYNPQSSQVNLRIKKTYLIPEDVETTNPEDVEATNPEDVEITNPEDVEATNPEDVEATNPEDVEATNPEDVEATNPQDVEATNPKDSEEEPSKNIMGEFYAHIVMEKGGRKVVTVDETGNSITLEYINVNGVTYVSKQWVEQFYNFKIESVYEVQ